MMKLSTILASVGLLAKNSAAQFSMLRFACSQLVVDRVDPLVNPGVSPSPHLHQIVGGSSFNVTMEIDSHDLTRSSCTSCNYLEDMSNYWTAVMFFRARNGSFHRVPQIGNGGPQGQLVNKGGLDVYYIPSGRVTAFAPGFRMLAGDAHNTSPGRVKSSAICHRCWNRPDENSFVGGAPCSGSDTVEIPSSRSCYMIRQTIIFPTCWDGKNLDSPDHQSHVTYGSGRGADGGGSCPSNFPVKLPQVMYEIMWDTRQFVNDPSIWPNDGKPAFYYSMGIGGAAAHGDYVFGWKGNSLQRAMDQNCNGNGACQGLTVQSPNTYSACTIRQQAPEPVDGWLDSMPGVEMA